MATPQAWRVCADLDVLFRDNPFETCSCGVIERVAQAIAPPQITVAEARAAEAEQRADAFARQMRRQM